MPRSTITRSDGPQLTEPVLVSTRGQTQEFGIARRNPLALDKTAAATSIDNLNQLLADTITLQSLYKKHHWQVSGPNFYMLHLLFDKHAAEQSALIDLLAERIQTLGGVSLAMAADVAETTGIPRPPKGREDPTTQIARLLHAHEIILLQTRAMAKEAADQDPATNDLLVSDVLRTNELQVWFLTEHTH